MSENLPARLESLQEDLIAPRDEAIAVTGFGSVTAAGVGADALWRSLKSRRSHLRRLRQIEVRGLAMDRGGEVDDAWLQEKTYGDRALRIASLAISEALSCAGLDLPPTGDSPGSRSEDSVRRVGLALGTALGAVQTLESMGHRADREQWRQVPLHLLTRSLAESHHLNGPRWTFSVTCVSGLYALEQALADLRFGRAEAMLCGGLDTLSLFMQSGFCALKALSVSGQLRPFAPGHDGIVLGEGAAFVVLERLSDARRRGASVFGILAGNSLVSDATHLTSPDASGRGMAEAIRRTMAEAGVAAEEIGCITPTATGSPVYDPMQSRAVSAVLGETAERIPVTTWEPVVGHALASTGVLGLVHAALVFERGHVLGTFGVEETDADCRLNYLVGRQVPIDSGKAVLALTVGFGGQNGATMLRGVAESAA